MTQYVPICLFVVGTTLAAAEEPDALVLPISGDESVLAMYCDNSGKRSATDLTLIIAIWPDGQIVWSEDRLHGGAPYREGQIDPNTVRSLLTRFEVDGLFADDKVKRHYLGPDSSFTTLLVKSAGKQMEMQSWHELYEASGKVVAKDAGLEALNGRRRINVLHKESAEYLAFRLLWSETRGELIDLIPNESQPSTGKLVRTGRAVSWHRARQK